MLLTPANRACLLPSFSPAARTRTQAAQPCLPSTCVCTWHDHVRVAQRQHVWKASDDMCAWRVHVRVAWRMADGSPARAREALAILDETSSLGGSLDDLLDRGVAAARTGHPLSASASFSELARKTRDEALIRRALLAVGPLPETSLPPGHRAALVKRLRAKLRATR